jgi:hypothetical protein
VIPRISLRAALNDGNLLGNMLVEDSWRAWRILLLAMMGEKLFAPEREVFTALTGRACEPQARVDEFAAVIGRRGGKSRAISVLASYLATLCTHEALVPGERGTLLIVAPDQKQSQIVLDYVEAALVSSPLLRKQIEGRTSHSIKLAQRIDISVRAADFRTLRGSTFITAICDEVAFWMNDYSANPDTEILTAIRPGLSTTGGPLIMISSPHARRGVLWDAYARHFGPHGDPKILVAQAASRTMNPSLPQLVIDRAMERDPAAASAEYFAQFRTDVESFVSREAVEACVTSGVFERPPDPSITYSAFVDPSGGSADAMSLAIGHLDYGKETVVIDAIRERVPPFSLEQVTEEFSGLLKSYGISTISGDRYAGEWPREQFGKFGIIYEPAVPAKSALYTGLLAMLNSARVELLDHAKLLSQLCSLERRTARGGRDSIDHPPGGHDDLANAVAGLVATNNQYGAYDFSYRGFDDQPDSDPAIARTERAKRAFALEWGPYSKPLGER